MEHRQQGALSRFLLMAVLVSLGLVSPVTAGAVWASEGGTGPDNALTPAGDWQPLAAKQSSWYGFYYTGDGSQIQVELQVDRAGSAVFAVWTPDEIWRWGLGESVKPIGRGSVDPKVPTKLVWSGNFRSKGTYYVVVERADDRPGVSHYLLSVSGTGVSLSKPTPTPAPTPKPKSQPKPAVPSKLAGKLVFQTTYGGPFYTINLDGSGLQRITAGIDPVWSPDGKRIAFVRWNDPRGVWLVNADGSGERLVFKWHQTRYPSWSPDGDQIVFSRQHRGRLEPEEKCVWRDGHWFCFTLPSDPHYNLGVVRASDGSFWEPLASTSERSLTPDWSPDGSQMAYVDVYGLYVQSADGQTRYQLTNNNKDTSPVWSPDGSKIAFTRRQHDHWEVYAVDADSKNLTRLTDTPTWADGTAANSLSPAWSPDGRAIAFLTDRTGKWEIWVMATDGSNPRRLFGTKQDRLTLQYAFEGERALDWTR
jgi:TolB protein